MVCQKTSNPLPMQTSNVASLTTSLLAAHAAQPLNKPIGSITADPNSLAKDTTAPAQVALSWKSYGTSKVEIRLNGPDGDLFASSGPGCFSKRTGHWAQGGMTFYLQNVSNGLPLAAVNTIATVTLEAADH
jgi:hypothetical protein